MKNLAIKAMMVSPVIRSTGYATLDSILAAIVFEKTGSIKAAHNDIPVEFDGQMPMASAAYYNVIEEMPRSFVGNLRKQHQFDFSLLKQDPKKPFARNPFESSFKDVMNTYSLVSASSITWYARGDKELIEQLLEPVSFIGKRRASGFGEVAYWSISETDEDPCMTSTGKPRRPIPAFMFKGDKSLPITDAAWRPAYWDVMNRDGCFVPSLADILSVEEKMQ